MTFPPTGPGWPPPTPAPSGYYGQGYPQPGYQQGYPPPGYPPPGYPPPGYPPPGYPPPGYGPGYPPPGYLPPMAMQPGVIPLRPLTLSDIFNGAVRYIRANPKATLGLAAGVVIITQVFALIIQIGPLAAMGELSSLSGSADSTPALIGSMTTSLVATLTQLVAGVVLSGMLTVIVGRAVFGSSITIDEAWAKIRGRILPLIGLVLLEALGALLLFGAVVLIIVGLTVGANGVVATVIGIPLGLIAFVAFVYLATVLSFAPVAVVLERLPVIAAIRRSFFLVHNDVLRVFGIRALAGIVAAAVTMAVGMPFALAQLIVGTDSSGAILFGTALAAVGAVIGQVLTAPFSAGVVVLLYTDRRIRAEAFDLVLRTGAAGGPAAASSTDHLWLTRR